jgi:hypothetical protein
MSDLIVGLEQARAIAVANVTPCSGLLGDEADDDETLRLAMVRLVASRLCPCSRSELRTASQVSLKGILPAEMASSSEVDDDIEALLGSGDLLRATSDDGEGSRSAIYLSPPMYVRRTSGPIYILGGIAEGELPFFERVRAHGPVRELVPPPTDEELLGRDVSPFPMDSWMTSPIPKTASEFLSDLNLQLDAASPSGDVGDVEVLDPRKPCTYYRGRWAPAGSKTGRFLARRRNRWGARTWGYVQMDSGQSLKWLSLPAMDRRFRGCDEAWQLICALDSASGKPQIVAVTDLENGRSRLELATPIPMWAERRLLLSGEYVSRDSAGSLAAFNLPAADASEEVGFLRAHLWLEPRIVG